MADWEPEVEGPPLRDCINKPISRVFVGRFVIFFDSCNWGVKSYIFLVFTRYNRNHKSSLENRAINNEVTKLPGSADPPLRAKLWAFISPVFVDRIERSLRHMNREESHYILRSRERYFRCERK